MNDKLQWKHSVTVSDLPPTGAEFELVADEAARKSLAERAGVPAVVDLTARLRVAPAGKGVTVEGPLEAVVRQNCVVTLEPFDNRVHEDVSLRFEPGARAADRTPHVEEILGEEPPEPLVDGKIDLAEVVAEFLTLSIDPYPRRPGAVFSPPQAPDDDEKEQSPFAALAKLKPAMNTKKK